MATNADKLVSEIRALPNEEKIRVLDAILTDLDPIVVIAVAHSRRTPHYWMDRPEL